MLARFKVKVQEVHDLHYSANEKYSESVTLTPVYDPNPDGGENRSFWEATPWGPWTVEITNRSMWGKFVVGDEHYLDVIPATLHARAESDPSSEP